MEKFMKKVLLIAATTLLFSTASYADKYETIGDVCKEIEGDVLENINQLHDIHEASKSKYYNAQQGSKEVRELLTALDWVSNIYHRLGCNRFGGL